MTQRNPTGCASAMEEPSIRMQSARAKSCCAVVAPPRPKEVPRRSGRFELSTDRILRKKDMRKILFLLPFCLPVCLSAAVINVEFKFTPFVGDPEKDKEVETVPGQAHIFLNNVPVADQEVRANKVPVLFEDHEIAPAVWVPVKSLGGVLRKGKNKIRIEFEPKEAGANYRAELRWASVTNQVTERQNGNSGTNTNEANIGVLDRKATGKVVMEKEFTADFAPDKPWHHYPAVTTLSDADKKKIAALLAERADWFKPDFAPIYKALAPNEQIQVDQIRHAKCLDAAYRDGLRLQAPSYDDLEFVTTGGPEVVVRSNKGDLFGLNEKSFAVVKDEPTQMCAGIALSTVFPPHLVVVRNAAGAWETVY
jgi:hypothetical protein